MRLLPLLSVLAIAAAAPALAQPRVAPATPPADTDLPTTTIAEDRAAAAALTAQLSALDEQIFNDEVRATQLRDTELKAENGRIAAVRPALGFHGKPVI